MNQPHEASFLSSEAERQTSPESSATRQRGESHQDHGFTLDWLEMARIVIVALAALAVWLHTWEPLSSVSLVGTAGLLIGGWPVFQEALEGLRSRRMTMELSMSIAIVAAAAISEFFTALIITLFVLIAEVLEEMTVSRGRRAIRELLNFLPRFVSVRGEHGIAEVEADDLAIGDTILISPGGRIPVDGTVVAGHSFADQSRITGESMPVEKTPGSGVFAGSINQSGALEVRAQCIGRDTSYGKIIEAVEQAEQSRAPVQRLADRLAGYLVYFALAAAALTYLMTQDVRSTIAVIIVAGACGIAAGTPLAILGAIGRAARAGAIIKGGRYLEQLGQVDTIVMDKTGTLTHGMPEVQELLPVKAVTAEVLLDAVATAELRSEHPLGKTIVSYARERGRTIAEPERFSYTPGRGIDATLSGEQILAGNLNLMRERGIPVPGPFLMSQAAASLVYVARSGHLLGVITIADHVRPEAQAAVSVLHAMGMQTVLLTGDSRSVAESVASHLGIKNVKADLLPEEKREIVRSLVDAGHTVAMVGDGINDAPALMQAHVGIAMGSGTDVARESADVVLLGNDLLKFAGTLDLARRTRRIIWTNFSGTIGIDLLGIVLAAFGLLSPLLAAFIHVTSEMIFILNSARLLPGRAHHS
ncbi:MAG: cation-translocating P-type ATPase [Castellaniella sp.]|uniref:heavy metal translocating P-type ATPase n=1 Tax=Castellaniella sp. TaxID=1955812 RepID=UPI00121A340F|nr:cation-translocating P-type ATPase [Castellaniella sp.]TAN27180.1 MAG: cation-translocating P-type ATPase [Castellaniella sp.]